jgi:GT2 family glycosyltransferase
MNSHPDYAAGVGKVFQMDNKKLLDSAGDFFDKDTYRTLNRGFNEKGKGKYTQSQEILSASAVGAIFRANALRHKMFETIFDEDLVSYIEDVDLSLRLKILGWKIGYVPGAKMFHKGSATSNKLNWKYKVYYSHRNRLIMALKLFPPQAMFKLLLSYILPSEKGLTYYKNFDKISQPPSTKKFLDLISVSLIHVKAVLAFIISIPKTIYKRFNIYKYKKISNDKINNWLIKYSI